MSGAKIHARLLAAVENYNVKEMKKKRKIVLQIGTVTICVSNIFTNYFISTEAAFLVMCDPSMKEP